MNILRRLSLHIVASLFSLCIILFAFFLALFVVLDKPEPLKGALRQSGLYSSVVDLAIAQQQKEQASDLALAEPVIQQSIKQAFPNSYIEATVEHNVDSTYRWIHGNVAKPQYAIDVTQPKERFATNIAFVVQQKLAGLPTCTAFTPPPTTPAEVLALTCKPRAIPDSVIVDAARRQAQTSNIFDSTAVRVSELKDDKGQSFTDKLQIVPKVYRYATWSLFALPGLAILCAVIMLFWSKSRRAGARSIAKHLVGVGVVSALLAIAGTWLLGRGVRLLLDQNTTLLALQSKILDVIHILTSQMRFWWIIVGVGYISLGVLLLALLRTKNGTSADNKTLDASLGYNEPLPTAGTTFDPGQEVPKQEKHSIEDNGIEK